MLLQPNEYHPRIYLGKDEVDCENIASMTRGGPVATMQEMGEYFQAVLQVLKSSNLGQNKLELQTPDKTKGATNYPDSEAWV